MTPEQNAYAIAKAHFDTVEAICKKEKAKLPPITLENNTDAAWKDYTAIEYKYKYWEALEILSEAEHDLVQATQRLLQTKRPLDYAKVKSVFEKTIYNSELRQKRVDLCFRLNVGTI